MIHSLPLETLPTSLVMSLVVLPMLDSTSLVMSSMIHSLPLETLPTSLVMSLVVSLMLDSMPLAVPPTLLADSSEDSSAEQRNHEDRLRTFILCLQSKIYLIVR